MATITVKDLRIDILKQEIELIQEKINHFDDLRHRTKQLAITLWAAAVGVGATTGLDPVLYLAAFIPFPFWFLDSTYHRYEEGYYARLKAIRTFIQSGRFIVCGQQEVSLAESLESDDFGNFPVPDFYGKLTIEREQHKRITHPLLNFIKVKTLIFYIPLVALPIAAVAFA
jgi:hypothetical protein